MFQDPKDPDTLISELKVSEAHQLMEEGDIGGGMLPKLNNCIEAIKHYDLPIIAVQWHPERIMDEESINLIKEFKKMLN